MQHKATEEIFSIDISDEKVSVDDLKKEIKRLRENEKYFELIFNTTPDSEMVNRLDDGLIIKTNDGFTRIFGYSREEVVGKTVYELNLYKNPSNRENLIKVLHDKGYYADFEETFKRKDGTELIGRMSARTFMLDGVVYASNNLHDITEEKLVTEKLRDSELKYKTYVQNAPDGIFITDEKMRYIEANNAASTMTGYTIDELLTMRVRDLTPDESLTDSKNFSQRIIEKGSSTGLIKFRHKNGSIRWWNMSVVRLSESRYLGFAKDVSAEKEIEKELVYISYHDQLTGLYNRRFFEEELKRLDTKRNLPISIIMADLNGLKIINDSFGHAIGDQLLKKAAHSITNGCRSDDIIARLGGDEFVILLPKADYSVASKIVDRIKNFTSTQKVSSIELSISFGIDTKTSPEQSINEILALTENQMYKNKLYERSSMRSKTIDIIMNTLYEKSNRELQHSERVSKICEEIALKMNMNNDDVNQVRTAGLVHDIGKIGIDEKILNKSGSLSNIEFIEIKKHPEIGWRILNSSNEFSELAQFILEHHEKWDGTGYPKGLKGEEISLKSRIIAIADAYDAMTSERSYRKGMCPKDALEEIKRCSGFDFDPKISSLFIELLIEEDKIGKVL